MPRSLQEIIDNQWEYARRFEEFEPDPDGWRDATPLRAILEAVAARAAAEQAIVDAVAAAREADLSWGLIGGYLGTSGEAARQRYGAVTKGAEKQATSKKKPPAKRPSKAS